MEIQPTKQWLRENPHDKSCFFEKGNGYEVKLLEREGYDIDIKNCHIILNKRDKYNCGWCVGINLNKNNLDKIRICQAAPVGKEDWSGEISIIPIDSTADEVLGLACALNIAVAEYINLDPAHRKDFGNMRRIKAMARK